MIDIFDKQVINYERIYDTTETQKLLTRKNNIVSMRKDLLHTIRKFPKFPG